MKKTLVALTIALASTAAVADKQAKNARKYPEPQA